METNSSKNVSFQEVMTEEELINFLRIPDVSKSKDYKNVVKNLKRMRNLPCIHISKQPLYPIATVRQWIQEQAKKR